MPRKTTGTGPTRGKKAATTTDNSAVQPVQNEVVPAVQKDAQNEVPKELRIEAGNEVRKNVTPITAAPKKLNVNLGSVNRDGANLDEEIRRRAYELYLQRNGAPGDPAQDWMVAEQEVRARHNGANQSAFAASHGGN